TVFCIHLNRSICSKTLNPNFGNTPIKPSKPLCALFLTAAAAEAEAKSRALQILIDLLFTARITRKPCFNVFEFIDITDFCGSSLADMCVGTAKMYTSRKKIHKDKDAEPTEFEETVAQALFDLENTNQDFKAELQDLYINSAVQMDVSGNRKAVVIYVPYRLRKAFRKVHLRLVRELEKKFSGKDVVLLATRRILRPPKKGSAVQRPRTRTLTAVHEAMLEDMVHPAEIVGKRTRYRIDGSKIMKVFLDPKEKNNTEYKLETFAGVYRKLTGKDVVFEYPITEA
ncbi:Small ribosomal subunit protein eS7 - like 3, partial [Theobroma cacao]